MFEQLKFTPVSEVSDLPKMRAIKLEFSDGTIRYESVTEEHAIQLFLLNQGHLYDSEKQARAAYEEIFGGKL